MLLGLGHLKIRAIAGGIGTLLLLYAVYASLVTVLVIRSASSAPFQAYVTIGGYLVFLLSGYTTGLFAKTAGFLNAAIVGAFAPFANLLYMLLTSQSFSSIREALVVHGAFWFVIGVVFCSIGGLIWDAQRRLTQ